MNEAVLVDQVPPRRGPRIAGGDQAGEMVRLPSTCHFSLRLVGHGARERCGLVRGSATGDRSRLKGVLLHA